MEHQQETIIATIRALEESKAAIDTLIIEQLQPKLADFEKELEQQLTLIRISSELEVVRQNEVQYRSELFSKETEETPESSKHNIFEDYDYDIIQGFEDKLQEILKASKIGGAATAMFNMENFDIDWCFQEIGFNGWWLLWNTEHHYHACDERISYRS